MPTTYAIPNGRTVMDATLYTGNGGTQTVVNTDNGTTGFKPDLVWYKGRTNTFNHGLFDSIRGISKQLFSNLTDAEATYSGVTAFNTNGFSLGSDNGGNQNAANYVAWQWQAGQGVTSSNTNGSITSTVSVNSTAGFSVVTYTGNGSTGTIGHGLGVAPQFIIVKSRTSSVDNWQVYHTSLGNTQRITLNTTNVADSPSPGMWNSTSPTSTVFSVGNQSGVNSATTYVAYCWAPIAGFSQFGSYTGNGSTSGPFIYTGFRPRWLMIKRTDVASDWWMYDSVRDPYNQTNHLLYADLSDAENTGSSIHQDFLSNGFRLVDSSADNVSSGTYIYAAFAENPFKYANAR